MGAGMRNDQIGLAIRIVDDCRDMADARRLNAAKAALPDISLEGARVLSKNAGKLLARIDALDLDQLPQALRLTIEVARERARMWRKHEDWYWTVFDPSGGGLFSMFAATPYGGGFAMSTVVDALKRAPLTTEGDRFRYFAGLADYGELLDQFAERTIGQAARGIFMPRAQAEAAVRLLDRIAGDQASILAIGEGRLAGQAAFKRDAKRLTADRVIGGLARLAKVLGPEYLGATKDTVGLSQYPGGDDIYAALVRHHGSTSLTPIEVHELGRERLSRIRTDMAKARIEAGFDGSDHEWKAHLDRDPAWRAEGDEAISAFFQRYIDRFAPHEEILFTVRPQATYGVRPLPDALAEATTFGYYDGPTPEKPHGDYVFNGRNLAQSSLIAVGALNYHELVPGHHSHLALQRENMALPVLRKDSYPTAYTEGWAEYAAALAGELGLYATPEERFGRHVMEAFATCRLVVDTGMNALGWSLEKARCFMRENSFFPETEICSETLRYSCDIPGQALAYKLGDSAMLALRAKMQRMRGKAFVLRDFHDAVLDVGALPLSVLDQHLNWVTANKLREIDQ